MSFVIVSFVCAMYLDVVCYDSSTCQTSVCQVLCFIYMYIYFIRYVR